MPDCGRAGYDASMKAMKAALLIFSAACAVCSPPLALRADEPAGPAETRHNGFVLAWSERGVEIREGGKKVFFYQRAPKSLDGKFPRANYLHPVYDLDGKIVTEDFPADHRHHRGIFWAWHHLSVDGETIGDHWACRDIVWDVVNVEAATPIRGDGVTLVAHVVWKSPLRKDANGELLPLVKETTLIRVHKASPETRKIDFEIRLRALLDNVRLGGSDDDKGYGGFSTRIKLPEDLKFTGRGRVVEPDRLSVDAGPWLDFSGSLSDSGATTGFAILQHPTLPDFPQRWILRRKSSTQNPVWPGNKPVALATNEPVVLRYRAVLHRGDASAANIGRLQREYEAEPMRSSRLQRLRPAQATLPGADTEIYKRVGGTALPIHIYSPDARGAGDSRPAIVFFFGGGWKGGSPGQFENHCRYLASRGIVAMTAEYRVLSRHGVRAAECFRDARSAIRWVRQNAERLGVDPDRVAAGGGSAGGHLAGALGTIAGFDEAGEDSTVSAVPDALVLFNPVLVLAPVEGADLPFAAAKMAGMPYRMGVDPERLSPWHHIHSNQPPAIIFHGKADTTVKYFTAKMFADKSKDAGNRCELVGFEGQSHGFFNYGKGGNKMYVATVERMDRFLNTLGYLDGPPTVAGIRD